MLTEVKKYINLIKDYFVLNLSAAMEYRVSFITQVLGMLLNNTFFIFFWWIVFRNTGSIGSYSFKDVMTIWGIAASAFGFSFILFGNARNITNLIIQGGMDVYLLQPKNVLINVICSGTTVSAWGDLIYGYILFFAVYGFDLKRLLLFTLFTVTGGIIFTGVLISAHSLTFHVGNATVIANSVFEFVLSFSLYPEDIFRGYVKFFVYSVIPAGFIAFLPMKVIKFFDIKILLLVLAAGAVYFAFAWFIFFKGLKKYESGNLIVNRM